MAEVFEPVTADVDALAEEAYRRARSNGRITDDCYGAGKEEARQQWFSDGYKQGCRDIIERLRVIGDKDYSECIALIESMHQSG